MSLPRINVAFCFDENMWMLAGVAIVSLLYHAMEKCCYDIYCVVPQDLSQSKRDELGLIVKNMDENSKIIFLNANNDFNDSVTHQYSIGIYFRFMLLKLLPKTVDRIIYSDVDVVFCDNLLDLYNVDMKNNLIAGVSDAEQGRQFPKNGNYINSGVLLMNMKELKKLDLYDKWIDLSKQDVFAYPDQDILNKTCDGKILYLPMRYNYMPGPGGRFEKPIRDGIYTQDDYVEAVKNPAIVHYILRQPWKNRENLLGDLWWKYAAMTPFYAYFRNKIDHEPNLIKKDILLFNCIKIFTVKVRQTRVKYYLFGFIPLFLIKMPDRF